MSAKGLTNLEEGIEQHWRLGRTVLSVEVCQRTAKRRTECYRAHGAVQGVEGSSDGPCMLPKGTYLEIWVYDAYSWHNSWYYLLSRYLDVYHGRRALTCNTSCLLSFARGRVWIRYQRKSR
ncbi:unnamed protein product [Clonostachys rosea]|uniref:Uncharacterized protein n=1 Tax=Bionectria ochroleuca TaxID=29856 RepID=A0ABY6UFX2_BIOOC|nr:unnamed protein product [Clonostachys rosea]